ncbi:hypothetical protein G9C85_03565 [Halorubellus sp. JP-L1]|uniref:hypothetical protein n=1 Tax=Halorubellus sp. JP-L1 TaxID=2715753 RepID=UPI00140B64DC|nr:hypothetical protein [Halorubellus sp. JP-L1]NHN40714.1 hypothetical protein [Halorubellus sp. JP-L1]
MSQPPLDPRDRHTYRNPTWRGVLVAYGLLAAVPASLWLLTHPLLGAVAVAAFGGLSVASHRTLELYRCVQTCGGFALDLGDSVQICVGQPAAVNC